jgi:uncharacterized protein YggE
LGTYQRACVVQPSITAVHEEGIDMGNGRGLTVGVVVTALLLGGCAAQSAAADATVGAKRTIIGTATGKVEGVPDTLTITLGVSSRADTAQAALAQSSERATKVIEALKAAGVAPQDLQTTELSLNPSYNRQGQIESYVVSNMVTAKVHDVLNAGKVVDAAAAQAGDDIRVQGVALSIEDTGRLVARARANAVARARTQAGQLAKAADVELGAVEKITERRADVPFPLNRSLAADSAAGAAPIEPGTQELSVDVTVVFAIR